MATNLSLDPKLTDNDFVHATSHCSLKVWK